MRGSLVLEEGNIEWDSVRNMLRIFDKRKAGSSTTGLSGEYVKLAIGASFGTSIDHAQLSSFTLKKMVWVPGEHSDADISKSF